MQFSVSVAVFSPSFQPQSQSQTYASAQSCHPEERGITLGTQ
mgnify:CR=1 FL=1